MSRMNPALKRPVIDGWKHLGLMHEYTDFEHHAHTKRFVWSDTKKPRETWVTVTTRVYGFLRSDGLYAEVTWQRRHVDNGFRETDKWRTFDPNYRYVPRGPLYLHPWRLIQGLPV